jgi:hypothetical protein
VQSWSWESKSSGISWSLLSSSPPSVKWGPGRSREQDFMELPIIIVIKCHPAYVWWQQKRFEPSEAPIMWPNTVSESSQHQCE